MDKPLTPAQQKILATVREEKAHTYSTRSRQPVERLEALGLVTVDWGADLDRAEKHWRITVWPDAEARRLRPVQPIRHSSMSHDVTCFCKRTATVHIRYGSGCGTVCDRHAVSIQRLKPLAKVTKLEG
jgi:hypothetical protein